MYTIIPTLGRSLSTQITMY